MIITMIFAKGFCINSKNVKGIRPIWKQIPKKILKQFFLYVTDFSFADRVHNQKSHYHQEENRM